MCEKRKNVARHVFCGTENLVTQDDIQTPLTFTVSVSCRLRIPVCVYVSVSEPFLRSVCVYVSDVFRAAGRFGGGPCDGAVRAAEAGHHRGPAVAR